MATNIRLKSSSVSNRVPTLSDLSLRELAINTTDGRLFLRKGNGTGSDVIVDLTDHGSFYGLSDDDHTQYLHSTITRTGVTAELNTTGKITTTNSVGIGTTNPVATLTVVGPNGAGLRIDQGNYNYYGAYNHVFRNSGLTSTFMTIDNIGNVGIGITNPQNLLELRKDTAAFRQSSVGESGGYVSTFGLNWSTTNTFIIDVNPTGASATRIFNYGSNGNLTLNYASTLTSRAFIITDGASERLRVNSSGNVGIGTTDPLYKLHVEGIGHFSNASSSSATSDFSAIYANTPLQTVSAFFGRNTSVTGLTGDQYSTSIRFNGNGVSWGDISYYPNQGGRGHFRFSLTANSVETVPNAKIGVGELYSAGFVGIGNTNPSTILGLNTTGTISWGSSAYSFIQGTDSISSYLRFGVSGSESLRITSTGVGIGTTNPQGKLHVQSGALIVNNGAAGSISAGLQLFSNVVGNADGSGQRIEFRSDTLNGYIEGVRDFAAGPAVSMRLGTVFGEAIRIIGSTSNVGIGTTNPVGRLHSVAATTLAALTLSTPDTGSARLAHLIGGNNYAYGVIGIVSGNGTQFGDAYGLGSSSNSNGSWSPTLTWTTQSGQNVPGCVGIGTTSPRVRLQVQGGDIALSTTEGTSNSTLEIVSDVLTNNGQDAAPGISFRAPFASVLPAVRITFGAIWSKKETAGQGGQEGSLIFGTNTTSGTGVTEKVRITSSGNVGIGTTNPSTRLHVSGDVRIADRTTASLFISRSSNSITAQHFYTPSNDSPWYLFGENLTWTGERIGTTRRAEKPYYEAFSPALGIKEFGFVNKTSADTSFIATDLVQSLVLKNNGNVGIGTTNPSELLDVNGRTVIKTGIAPFYALKLSDYSDTTGLYLGSVSGGTSRYIGDAYYYNSFLWRTDKTTASFINFINGSIEFYNNTGLTANTDYTPSRKMILDTSGFLLINRSAATGTASQNLQVEGGAYISGNVGIGTTNPQYNTHIYGSVAGTVSLVVANKLTDVTSRAYFALENDTGGQGAVQFTSSTFTPSGGYARPNALALFTSSANSSGGIAIAARNSSGYIDFYTGGNNPRAIIDSTGNVGIGITNPSNKVHIYSASGTSRVQIDSGSNNSFVGYDGSTNDLQLASSTNIKLQTGASYNEVVRVSSSGNVGVGTTNPLAKLHVESGVNSDVLRLTSINAEAQLRFFHNAGTTYTTTLGSQTLGADNVGLVFRTGTGGGSNRMAIDVNGNVGIGVTIPSSKLDVNGTARFGSSVYLNGSVLGLSQSMEVSSSGYGTLAAFRTVPNDGINPYLLIETSTDGITLTSDGSSYRSLFLKTGGSTKIKLDTSGNFTPSADATQNLGSTSFRWANIYSADLQLSNEGSSNDVDGTWGAYTIQEGEEDLFLINRRNGKKYKFVLQEVN